MRRRRNDCNPSSAGLPGSAPPNAFTDELLDALDEREPEPFAPDGELPGPWRFTRLWGDGPPLWAIYGLGELAAPASPSPTRATATSPTSPPPPSPSPNGPAGSATSKAPTAAST